MKRFELSESIGGWFIGDFEPTFLKTNQFEVCLKRYRKGETEPLHYQLTALEITLIISGTARMGDEVLQTNEAIMLEPFEAYDFEALTDVILVAIKTPSIPSDKKMGLP